MRHLIHGARAAWSALAGVAAMIERGGPDARVEVLGDRAARRRAARAGVSPRGDGPTVGGAALAWDDASEAERRRRGLDGARAPEPVPPRPALLVQPDAARSALRLAPDERAVALLGVAGMDFDARDPAALAGVLGLADRPAALIVIDGPSPPASHLASLARVAPRARVLAPADPPWATLPACAAALVMDAIDHASPITRDLARWAAAAGVGVIVPAHEEVVRDDARRRRYAAARALSRALAASVSAPGFTPGSPRDDSAFEAWLSAALISIPETVSAQSGG